MQAAIRFSVFFLSVYLGIPSGVDAQNWSIALHGGAGSSSDRLTEQQRAQRIASLERALKIGADHLSEGGTSLDAVEKVIRYLEDSPIFNAGKGAVFNAVGSHQLDASIMDGQMLSCGAVAGVTVAKNPISVARLVMTKTRHVLLANDGADRFAADNKVELVDADYFWTPALRKQFKRLSKKDVNRKEAVEKGTVGCVALDTDGNLAAGTSTGGLVMKKFGRVGDSPIIGAGTYANNKTCAVSCTGIGEEYIRHSIAYSISARMQLVGDDVATAVSHAIKTTLKPGDGGIIAVSKSGDIAVDYNTPGMSFGYANSKGKFVAGLEK